MNAKQRLIPIALIFFSVFSIYYLISEKTEIDREYAALLSQARYEAENRVVVAAEEDYAKLQKLKPSVSLMLEQGEMYFDVEDYDAAFRFYRKTLLTAYPLEAETYSYGIRAAVANEDIGAAFEVYEKCKKRELLSENIEKLMDPIRYAYVLRDNYEDATPFMVSTGVAAVKSQDSWWYINKRGTKALSFAFNKAGLFGESGPVVAMDGTVCYIDGKGNISLPASYFENDEDGFGKITEFKYIQSGLVLATDGKTWNFYNKDTRSKLCGGFKEATVVANGVGAVSLDGKKWALIDAGGNFISDYVYDEVLSDAKDVICRGNAIIVKQNGKYFLIDKTGGRIGNAEYEDARAFNEASPAAVKKKGKWIFVDDMGHETSFGDYQDAGSFSNGLAAVQIDYKWGYIDVNGNVVVEPVFKEVMPVSTLGVTFVRTTSDTWSLIQFYKENYDFL